MDWRSGNYLVVSKVAQKDVVMLVTRRESTFLEQPTYNNNLPESFHTGEDFRHQLRASKNRPAQYLIILDNLRLGACPPACASC